MLCPVTRGQPGLDEKHCSPAVTANVISTLTVVSQPSSNPEASPRGSGKFPQEPSEGPGEGYSNMAVLILSLLYIGLSIRFI